MMVAKVEEESMPEGVTVNVNYGAQGDRVQEATMKTVSGKKYPASDFLVVEDPEKPSTFHLQVKRNGTPDHGLMGGAKAALTSPGGHRGNKYEGPNKAAAIRKLKALYKAEDMEWGEAYAEYIGGMEQMMSQIRGAFNRMFSPPMAADVARPAYLWVKDIFTGHPELGDALVVEEDGLMWAVGYEVDADGKVTFAAREQWEMVIPTYVKVQQKQEAGMAELETFTESAEGSVISLVEAQSPPAGAHRAPVEINMRIIKPGAGNKKDNHWYPADVLKRDAHVFEGVDVFVTDHKENERSERTKVGKIKSIVGFDEDGGPIGRTVIYDPEVAEKTRNRAKAGELSTLHCSISANGTAKKGEVDGKEYKIVETITYAGAVDLVSRAGAGGQALGLRESEAGGTEPMEDEMIVEEQEQETENVTISEQEPTPDPEPAPDPVKLAAEKVQEALTATNLPPASVFKLAGADYADETSLAEAIKAEVAEVKERTGSGRPFAQGGGGNPPGKEPLTEEQKTVRFNEILEMHGAKTVPTGG